MTAKKAAKTGRRQLLHLVFGGELTALDKVEFSNLKALDIVGIYPNYAEAHAAWRDAAQRSVDDAHMRYFCSIPRRPILRLKPATSGKNPEVVAMESRFCESR